MRILDTSPTVYRLSSQGSRNILPSVQRHHLLIRLGGKFVLVDHTVVERALVG